MAKEMKRIQFGAGGNILPGWVNHDYEVNITKPLPYPDEVADVIFAEHVVEHVTGPEAFRFMKEVNRLLVKGGMFRICVPELARLGNEKRVDIICNHGHLLVFAEESLRLMLEAAGFTKIEKTGRDVIDNHWKVIGEPLDTQETLRMIAFK